MEAGDWFGEVPVIDGTARAFEMHATAAAEVAVLSSDDFWRLLGADPGAMAEVLRLAASRYRMAAEWIEEASLHAFPERLAILLERQTASTPEADRAWLRLSQEDLADHLGVSRQTVNRQLRRWEQRGLLRLKYRAIQIESLSRLRGELAAG